MNGCKCEFKDEFEYGMAHTYDVHNSHLDQFIQTRMMRIRRNPLFFGLPSTPPSLLELAKLPLHNSTSHFGNIPIYFLFYIHFHLPCTRTYKRHSAVHISGVNASFKNNIIYRIRNTEYRIHITLYTYKNIQYILMC